MARFSSFSGVCSLVLAPTLCVGGTIDFTDQVCANRTSCAETLERDDGDNLSVEVQYAGTAPGGDLFTNSGGLLLVQGQFGEHWTLKFPEAVTWTGGTLAGAQVSQGSFAGIDVQGGDVSLSGFMAGAPAAGQFSLPDPITFEANVPYRFSSDASGPNTTNYVVVQELSFDDALVGPPQDEPTSVIHLDFASSSPVEARYIENIMIDRGDGDYRIVHSDTVLAPNVSPDDQQALLDVVAENFRQAGLENVEVVLDPTAYDPSIVTTVYFTHSVPLVEDSNGNIVGQLGNAFDIGASGESGPDRFNTRSDAEVVAIGVPGDPAESLGGVEVRYDVATVAKTVLHEVGHAYGLRHLLNADTDPTVMAQGQTGLQFSMEVEVASRGYTQNSAYHLQRYVDLMPEADIALAPGTWDVAELSDQIARVERVFDLSSVANLASEWYLGLVEDDALRPYELADGQFGYLSITDRISTAGTYLHNFDVGQEWAVFASSTGQFIDIVAAFGDRPPEAVLFSGTEEPEFLSFYQFNASSGAYTYVGAGGVQSTSITVAAVPLPASCMFLTLALSLMWFSRLVGARKPTTHCTPVPRHLPEFA